MTIIILFLIGALGFFVQVLQGREINRLRKSIAEHAKWSRKANDHIYGRINEEMQKTKKGSEKLHEHMHDCMDKEVEHLAEHQNLIARRTGDMLVAMKELANHIGYDVQAEVARDEDKKVILEAGYPKKRLIVSKLEKPVKLKVNGGKPKRK